MIPILYDKNEQDFSHNGIGYLTGAIKATVTEERNGSYELSLQYPITGIWYDRITRGSIIKAQTNETSAPQLFRVYKSSKPLKGVVTYSCEHISYDLNGIPVVGLSVKNATPQMAMTQAFEAAVLPCQFTALSDISTINSTTIENPCSLRSILGGQSGSVLDVWGGEYEFDNFIVRLHSQRGTDNGVTIEYGKNLKDLKQEENITECYTHLLPYAVFTPEVEDSPESSESKAEYVYLPEKVLPLTDAEDIGHNKVCIMDFSDRFGEGESITEDALRSKAAAYAERAGLGVPKVNITVSFVQLWQTEEYKSVASLERVKLCDTVTVRFLQLGVDVKAKVIKTVYNALLERYDSITLGDAKSSFADTINDTISEIKSVKEAVNTGQSKTMEALKKAIKNATDLITGNAGGYVVLHPAENPQEVLILDAPTIEEAVHVWRWNSGGLGYSSTGYNGEYKTAITMDGSIVADFITTGILNASLIKTGTIASEDGTFSLNLGSGELSTVGTSGDKKIEMVFNKGKILTYSLNSDGSRANNLLYIGHRDNAITWFVDMYNPQGILLAATYGPTRIGNLDQPVMIEGHVQKGVLFSGSADVGSTFTVWSTSKYDLFAVKLGDSSGNSPSVVLAYKYGNTIYGVGGWCGTSTEYKELYFLSATFSGDTWTLVDAGVHDVYMTGGISAGSRLQLKEVIGVI